MCLSEPSIHGQLYGDILLSLGSLYHQKNAFNDTEACYQKALRIFQEINDVLAQGTSYSGLGYLCIRQGKINEAFTLYQSAIRCHQMVNATSCMGCQGPSHGGSYMDEGTFTLGLDYSPLLFQGTVLPLPLTLCLLCCSRVHI